MIPDISVIIPLYNTERYIEQCLSSILQEKDLRLEVLIIDDASSDKSLDVARKIAKDDVRCRIISLSNNTIGGSGIPSNIGIENATGKYISFVDSDDWIASDMYKTLFNEAERTNSDLVVCDFFQVNNITNEVDISYDQDHWKNFLCNKNINNILKLSPVPWRKLYNNDYLSKNNIKFPESDYYFEDTPFHFYSVLKASKISYVYKPLYFHRVFRENQTMDGKGDKFLAFIHHDNLIFDFMKKENLFKTYYNEYLKYVLDNFYWVWDRLNNKARKQFFCELNKLLINIDDTFICNFLGKSTKLDKVRLLIIFKNKYFLYKCIMIACKSRGGCIIDIYRMLNKLKRFIIKQNII